MRQLLVGLVAILVTSVAGSMSYAANHRTDISGKWHLDPSSAVMCGGARTPRGLIDEAKKFIQDDRRRTTIYEDEDTWVFDFTDSNSQVREENNYGGESFMAGRKITTLQYDKTSSVVRVEDWIYVTGIDTIQTTAIFTSDHYRWWCISSYVRVNG